MKNVLKIASVVFYSLCSIAVVTLFVAFFVMADKRETIEGYIMMCGLPMSLACFALFLNFKESIRKSMRKPSLKWLIAVPPAIVAVYLVDLLFVIIVMGISMLMVTILKA